MCTNGWLQSFQNSAGVADDYAALDEAARVELLIRAELSHNRPLGRGEWTVYSEETAKELAIIRAAAQGAGRFRHGRRLPPIISAKPKACRTCWRFMSAETGRALSHGRRRNAVKRQRSCRCRCSRPSPTCRPHLKRCEPFSRFHHMRALAKSAGASGSDDRLFGFEQGRRLSDLDMGII